MKWRTDIAYPDDYLLEVYLEHLEEASFLYDQRRFLLGDPELTWLDLEAFEERFEAHIDGLVLGEELALAVCQQQAREGDFGELHAAVRVFCRQQRLDLVQEVLDELDPTEEERVQAVHDALCHELPEVWEKEVIQMLASGDELRLNLAARVIGYKRLDAADQLLQVMPQVSTETLLTVIWALDRLRYQQAYRPLYSGYLQHEHAAVREAAALALLRLGDASAASYVLRQLPFEEWSLLAIGLGAARSHVPRLREVIASGRPTSKGLLALGLLGDPSVVDLLLYYLGDEARAEAAATALNLITGAHLYEEVFIPEEIDEDMLFDDELERLAQDEPLYEPGEEPGTELTRLSQNPEEWKAWWNEHRAQFQPEMRYRNGQPYAPSRLLENLTSEKSPRQVRQLAYEELVIRYGIDVPFETDMFVTDQKRALSQLQRRIEEQQHTYRAGKWYLAGQMMGR